MNQIHVLLSIQNVHVLLRHESDTRITVLLRHESYTCITVLHVLSIHNVHTHVLLRHESDTCITVYT